MTLEERIKRIEDEMYAQGFWQRPASKPKELSTAEAFDVQILPDSMGISLSFSYRCGVCDREVRFDSEVVTPEAYRTRVPFYLNRAQCSNDLEHRTKVIFPVVKD